MGDLIQHPNPTTALELLNTVINYLIKDCSWTAQSIHFFGFAQGGTVCVEFCLKWWKEHSQAFGSVVSISGPLLSYPTITPLCPTPLLIFHRNPPSDLHLSANAFTSFRKGFNFLKDVKKQGEGMLRSKQEWTPIMEFWSQRLAKRQVGGLYEVMSGMTSP